MNLPDIPFSWAWVLGGFAILVIALIWAAKTAPWHKIRKDSEAQHVFLGSVLILFFSWLASASLEDGLSFHLLLVTTVTLMFGPQFAIFSALLALAGVTIMESSGLWMFGVNAVLMILIPVLISWQLAVWAYRFLEHNFFVFILFNGFFAAGLSMFTVLLMASGVMYFGELHEWEKLMQSFLPYIPLMVFPEAFVNGMILLALVMFKPQWVSCFDDDHYLKGK